MIINESRESMILNSLNEKYDYPATSLVSGSKFKTEGDDHTYTVIDVINHGKYHEIKCKDENGNKASLNFDYGDKVEIH